MLFNTLASFIWGINTLFLLDAGLSATAAFTANALFTAGMVLFEVPTRWSPTPGAAAPPTCSGRSPWPSPPPCTGWPGRWRSPSAWAVTSALLGLGFTFFSGATEAWLVDALKFTGFKGNLESVFAKGQIVSGAAMLLSGR